MSGEREFRGIVSGGFGFWEDSGEHGVVVQ